jgi:outer membrane protein assembly factor BamB
MPSAPETRSFDDWVSLYYDHALNSDELREFDAMLAADSRNADRFIELSTLHISLCQLEKSAAAKPRSGLARWPILDVIAAIAAVVLLTITITKLNWKASPASPPSPQVSEEGNPQVKEVFKQAAPAGNLCGWRRDGTGLYPDANPPTQWDEKKNVKWKAMVGGSHSAPVIVGEKVFVTSERSTLTCVDRATGKVLWVKTHNPEDVPAELAEELKTSLGSSPTAGFATPTPVSDGKSIFVVFGSGIACRYDLAGNRNWIRMITPTGLSYGQSASPLLADDKLIISLDKFEALDAGSGKTIWQNGTIEKAYGTPALMKLDSTPVMVTPSGFAVQIADGKVLAQDIAAGLGGDEFSISPVVKGDVVYYIDRACTAVKLELTGGLVRAKTLWSADLEEVAFASPVLHEGLIFACGKTGYYSVLDAKTGTKLLEKVLELAPAGGQAQEMSNANVYPSLSVAGGFLFVSNDQGQTFVLKPSKKYAEVGRNQLPEGSGACLAFDKGNVFLRSGDFLYCVGQ